MNRAALRYSWLTVRRDPLWFPPAFLAAFVVITLILRHPEIQFTIARAYLGFMVPLLGGMMAAYAVLDDPALELRFATPSRPAGFLFSRLGLVLTVQALSAVAYQVVLRVLHVDLAPLGGWLAVQLCWLLPTVSLMALATFGSLATTQTAFGAFLAGAGWLLQVVMRPWLLLNARLVYLFMGVVEPNHPSLAANRIALSVVTAGLLLGSWALLRRPERFLGARVS